MYSSVCRQGLVSAEVDSPAVEEVTTSEVAVDRDLISDYISDSHELCVTSTAVVSPVSIAQPSVTTAVPCDTVTAPNVTAVTAPNVTAVTAPNVTAQVTRHSVWSSSTDTAVETLTTSKTVASAAYHGNMSV